MARLAMFAKVRRHNAKIRKLLSTFMLAVFAIALTPWNVVHHHKIVPEPQKEAHCTHLSHVQAHGVDCLICKANFTKHYTSTHNTYKVYLSVKIFNPQEPVLPTFYTKLIQTSLRGPPLV